MIRHSEINAKSLRAKLRLGEIQWGGNARLKIYGTLKCKSGKRTKKENRVFFKDESRAMEAGFRPCGHCLNAKYQLWKNRKQLPGPWTSRG